MKWLLAAAAAVLLAGYVYWQRQSVKTTYVNGLAPYTGLAGREYILERDCYIFKLKGSDSDWPYVASHATVPDLPADVDAKNIGTDTPGARLLDIVTVGTHFRIVSVRRDQKGDKTTITYEILLADEATRKYPRVDALYMLDHTAEDPNSPPSIVPDYAVPRHTNTSATP